MEKLKSNRVFKNKSNMTKPTYTCACGKTICMYSKTIHERSRQHKSYLRTEDPLRPVHELLIRECLSAFKNGYYNENDYDTVGMNDIVIEKLMNDVISNQIEGMPLAYKEKLLYLPLNESNEMDIFHYGEECVRNNALIRLYLKRISVDVIKNALINEKYV